MKRRNALKSLGLGLSAGLILPQLISSCKKKDPGPEVVFSGTVAVIGAGAAGLYAADILRSKGINVIVLEASGRLGGRMKSFKSIDQPSASLLLPDNPLIGAPEVSIADFPIELGAEVIYGSDSILGKVISDLGAPTIDLANATNQFILDDMVKSAADWGGDSDFNAVQNFISGLPNFSGPGSVETAAGVSARGQALLNSQVGNFYGSSSSRVGAQALAEGLKAVKHDGKLLTLKGNQLQDLLLSRFSQVTPKVQLNTIVKSIEYSGDQIAITDQEGNVFNAEKVIVTVPVSILKSGGITFSPSLPGSWTSSLGKFGMDKSIRVFIDFKKNFWGTDTGFIWGGTTGPQYFNVGAGRSEFHRTLSITINGPKAEELSGMGRDMIPLLIAELDAIYDGNASLFVRVDTRAPRPDGEPDQFYYIIQDWGKEEFIKGGYSYPLVGATHDDHVNLAKPVNEKVFFAGEATDINGDAGTVNGAFASAERVTEEVIKSIMKI